MFFISFPKGFKIGDTADCRINHEPTRVIWRDADHLIIEPDDTRTILALERGDDLISFTCGDAGATLDDYEGEMSEAGTVVSTKVK
jgi:hypothetical protein